MLLKKEEERCLLFSLAALWNAEASGAEPLGQNVPEGGLQVIATTVRSVRHAVLGLAGILYLHSDGEMSRWLGETVCSDWRGRCVA